jgi:DNA-damage-inducible protein D
VRKTLNERGIVPEELAPEEDINKVERRHSADARKLEKPRGPSKKK